MDANTRQRWSDLLRDFSEKNCGRKTRLGVFEDGQDYWIEDGLPLTGVDLDPGNDAPSVQIMLGNFTHTVRGVNRISFHHGANDDGFDVVDFEGRTAFLRFER